MTHLISMKNKVMMNSHISVFFCSLSICFKRIKHCNTSSKLMIYFNSCFIKMLRNKTNKNVKTIYTLFFNDLISHDRPPPAPDHPHGNNHNQRCLAAQMLNTLKITQSFNQLYKITVSVA